MANTERKRGQPQNIALDSSKQKEFNQKITKAKKNKYKGTVDGKLSGVVYIKHLPWGFEEEPIREYFSQFGTVKNLKLARSKKTGNSKGYAHIQFASDEVAKIVADTMNNYLMFEKLIKCQHLENAHLKTFKNAGRKFMPYVGTDVAIKRHNRDRSKEELYHNKKSAMTKKRRQLEKLAAVGIDEDYLNLVTGNSRKRKASDSEEGWKEMSQAKSPKLDAKEKDNQPVMVKTPGKPVSPMKGKTPLKTPKRQSLMPKTVDTPQGKMNVLIEDSSDEEIAFKTPPMSIRSSKLDKTTSEDTPNTGPGKTPKGKKTPAPKSAQKSGNQSKTPAPAKGKSAEVSKTPGDKKSLGKTPKSGNKKASLETNDANIATPNLKTPKSAKGKKTPKLMEVKAVNEPQVDKVSTPKIEAKVAKTPKTQKTPKGPMEQKVKTPAKAAAFLKTPKSEMKLKKSGQKKRKLSM